LGVGEIRLETERPEIILPREMELIIRAFWKEPERCRVLYDKQRDCIYIIPEKIEEEKTERWDSWEVKIRREKSYLKLHEAIAVIIYANGNKPMKPPEILEKIKFYDLYRKRNGDYPDISQIHARISNYSKKPKKLFERTNEGVVLTNDGIRLAQEVRSRIVWDVIIDMKEIK